MAARSFTLPPGFKYSSFAKTSAASDGTMLPSRSIGVSPTNSVIFSATRRRALEEMGTLQGTEAVSRGQCGNDLGDPLYPSWLERAINHEGHEGTRRKSAFSASLTLARGSSRCACGRSISYMPGRGHPRESSYTLERLWGCSERR